MTPPTRPCFSAALLLLAALLSGCSSRSNVSTIGNVPGQYAHVYITAQAVWFNTSASAGPDDSGWVKFALSTPATVDLVTDSNGNFGTLATDLKLTPGSYSQVRLIPVDYSAPLTISAQALGAKYNAEADYIDSSGTTPITQQLPLELLNPDRGIGIQTSLSVPLGNIGGALSGATPSGTTATPTTTTATTSTSTTSTTRANFVLSIDGARDLTAFSYAGGTAVMLSSHASAHDLSASGGIQGTLTLTNLANISSASGLPDIQVSAELMSADGSRHFVVASTPVNSDGSFTLYPLAANSSNSVDYDLVIHGGGIATIIIKDVQIPASGTASTTATTTSTSTTSSTPSSTTITPTNLVSIGTLIPRAATAYSANIAAPAGSALPAGAQVGFYQTLPASGEVPYVIEAAPLDPFNQNLLNPPLLSAGTLDSGTYVSSGATVTVVSSAPNEGVGSYQVAASAPLYADGLLGIRVSAPASGTTATPVTVAGLSLASGSTAATLTATLSNSGNRDRGVLLVTHDGQLVASAVLDSVLTGGGTVLVTGIPGGTAESLYYLTVRAWNSSNPAGTLSRQWYSTPVDLRSASSANAQLTVN